MKRLIYNGLIWFFACLCLLSAVIFNGSAYALAALIFLAAAPFVSLLINLFVRKKLTFSLKMPPSAEKNRPVSGFVTVRNRSRMPVGRVLCRIEIENTYTAERETLPVSFSVSPRAAAEKPFGVRAPRCGYLDAAVKRIRITDLFGFLPLSVKAPAEAAGTPVSPDIFAVSGVLPDASFAPEHGDGYADARSGYDLSEPRGLRDYRPGDSPRAVHWKLSEKAGRFIVREGGLPAADALTVYLEKSSSATPDEKDAMAEAAASIAAALTERGAEFTLGWSENGGGVFKKIMSADDLTAAVPEMLRYGGNAREPLPDGLGAVARIRKVPDGTLLLELGDADTVRFTAENYRDILRCPETAP